jgi:hypothetical protein
MKIGSPLQVSYISISQEYKPHHQALDIGLPTTKAGTLCQAVEDGIAGSEGNKVLKKYGFTLQGNSGALYFYNHCRRTVSNRQKVKRGDIIGVVDTVERQNKFRKAFGAPLLGPDDDHQHFEIHPTGDWNVRDNPLYYFDHDEVKYRRQRPAVKIPLNYEGLPDKHVKGAIMYELKEKDGDLWMVNIQPDHHGTAFVKKNGKNFAKYDQVDSTRPDRKVVGDMAEAFYEVDWAHKKKYFVKGDPCKGRRGELLDMQKRLSSALKTNERLNRDVGEYKEAFVKLDGSKNRLEKTMDAVKKEREKAEKVIALDNRTTSLNRKLKKKIELKDVNILTLVKSTYTLLLNLFKNGNKGKDSK